MLLLNCDSCGQAINYRFIVVAIVGKAPRASLVLCNRASAEPRQTSGTLLEIQWNHDHNGTHDVIFLEIVSWTIRM
jgi:hypothetical protein